MFQKGGSDLLLFMSTYLNEGYMNLCEKLLYLKLGVINIKSFMLRELYHACLRFIMNAAKMLQ